MLHPHDGEWICVEKRRVRVVGRAKRVRRRGRRSDRGSILVGLDVLGLILGCGRLVMVWWWRRIDAKIRVHGPCDCIIVFDERSFFQHV